MFGKCPQMHEYWAFFRQRLTYIFIQEMRRSFSMFRYNARWSLGECGCRMACGHWISLEEEKMHRGKCVFMCAATGALLSSASALAVVEVLYNQITGHPKAIVPAGAGLVAGTEFKLQITSGFDRPYASPDGTKIFLTGLANLATTEDECYIVWDNGTAATVAREGTTFGSPTGENLGTGNQRMGINNAGQFAFVTNLGAVTAVDKGVVVWDGVTFNLLAREGGAVPGIAGETWGDGLNSAHILADGTGLFCAVSTAGALPTTEDDFCMIGNTIHIQSGDAIEAAFWDAMNVSDFWMTSDGAHWLLIGDDTTATAQDRILAVDGVVQAREGVPLIGSSYTSNVSASFGGTESVLCNDGSYLLRGHNVDGHDWVLRNGTVIAEKAAPITIANTELYDDTTFANLFFFIAGNNVGDWVVGGVTNADAATNAVLVLNGTEVVAREGDMIDLNGNGLADDDAFISIFNDDDGVLTDDMQLIFFANCVDAAAVSLGQMVLRLDLSPAPPACPGDIAPLGGDGVVNVQDMLGVINAWGACGGTCPPSCVGDIAPAGGDCTVNVVDLLGVINGWGACP
jgi:hypothetical protein